MARPREFDRDKALHQAMQMFWAKGFAATSTDDLLEAMRIGRQSLYNTFGDKRQLYLETLDTYLQGVTAAHLARLNGPASPLEGLRNLLTGLTPEDDRLRSLGCMGICSIGEFGPADAQVTSLRQKAASLVAARLVERIGQGQTTGEIDPAITPADATAFVQMAMNGLQIAARGGAAASELAALTTVIMDRLTAH